jgi:hypothetical protein
VRGKKTLASVIPLVLIVLTLAAIPSAYAGTAMISIDPSATLDVMTGYGFSVNIYISDVLDLGGWEVQLDYDTTLLTATDVTLLTDWFGPDVFPWKVAINDAAGNIHCIVTLPLGTMEGIDGSGAVATIDFTVEGTGLTVLDLHGTLLGDPEAKPIMHTAMDGFFANVPVPQLWIEGKGAMGGGVYPEWHVNVPGTTQTLYSRIVNTGDAGAYVKAIFKVYAPGVGTWMIESNVAWLDPKPLVESVTVSAIFTETDTECLYYVSGSLLFSLDGMVWAEYRALEPAVGGDGTARDIATKFKTLAQYS